MNADHELLAQRTEDAPREPRYRKRRDWELEQSALLGWCKQLVNAADEVERATAAGIVVGPARGGAEGSLLLWLLGATLFDPIEKELDPKLFYGVGRAAPSLSFWADIDRPPLFVQHPTLAREAAGLPQAFVDVSPPWDFDRWPNCRQILTQLGADDLEARTVATTLARPGPAGCGMLQAYLAQPAYHRWSIFKDSPPDDSEKPNEGDWQHYEFYRGHAMGEALLAAAASGEHHIVQCAGARSVTRPQGRMS